MDYHLFDARGVFTETVDVDEAASLPLRGTSEPPPDAEGGNVAIWNGAGWTVGPIPEPVMPRSPDMPALRQQALATAMAYGNAITAGELNQWAGVEPLSWTQQREEALKVRDGQELDAFAVLPGLAEDKGISLADYSEDVLFNAGRMQRVLRAAVYLRRSATKRLLNEDLDTPEKLAAEVEALRVEADALAAQLLAADQAAAAARAA